MMKKELVKKYITDWLTDYCREHGAKGFVTGVSGGIDSALTSTLCAQTGFDTIVLSMPIFQSEEQLENATRHIKWLKKRYQNVKDETVNLEQTFNSIKQDLSDAVQDDHTMANTRSRLRMVALYAYSTHYNMLVAGTGNRVEDFGIGFFTKHGDGGVDLSPIADLVKSEVYELAEFLGIESEIIKAPPADGLWDDARSDEDQIGASYSEMEWAMDFLEKGGKEDNLSPEQKRVISIFKDFNRKNRHKMVPVPVCRIPDELKNV